MERMAWTATILEGKAEEYIRRHDEIWPEMVAALKEAGIVNYSIWQSGNTLFGYYECSYGLRTAEQVQAGSEVVSKWNEYMKDVMRMEMDPVTGAQPKMEEVFRLE